MPSGGGPSALAGADVPTGTSVMTAAAVRPREVITIMLPSGLGVAPACGEVHRVSQCGTGRTKDSAVRRMTSSQRIEERSCPPVDVVNQYLTPQCAHPAPPLVVSLVERRLDCVFDALGVVRVDQVGLSQFGCGTGEFAEYQCTAEVAAACHVLLGHQIHPVPQRGDQHDITGHEIRDELLAGNRSMQVMHCRVADFGVFAVDVAHLSLDVLAQLLIAVHPFTAG